MKAGTYPPSFIQRVFILDHFEKSIEWPSRVLALRGSGQLGGGYKDVVHAVNRFSYLLPGAGSGCQSRRRSKNAITGIKLQRSDDDRKSSWKLAPSTSGHACYHTPQQKGWGLHLSEDREGAGYSLPRSDGDFELAEENEFRRTYIKFSPLRKML
jgi:hypothetical protein